MKEKTMSEQLSVEKQWFVASIKVYSKNLSAPWKIWHEHRAEICRSRSGELILKPSVASLMCALFSPEE
jgi:hypothetical protein